MKCSCPKCNASISPDIQEIPPEGNFTKCPECHAHFLLIRESFAKRALRKGSDISCANCGSQLGPSIYCPGCHALYPDYHLTESSSLAKQQLKKILSILNVFKRLVPSHKPSVHHDISIPSSLPTKSSKGIKLTGNPVQIIAILVAVVALIIGGGYYYWQQKIDADYTDNYVRALFGVKSGRDFNVKIGTQLAADWKKRQTPLAPRLGANEQAVITSAKGDVDILMKRLENSPKKFAPNNAALTKLYDTYAKLHATTSSPSGSADSYIDSINKIDEEFVRNSKELKSSLPPILSEGLNESKVKYKALKDF